MEQSIALVRRHWEAGTIHDERGKVSSTVLGELGSAGYCDHLIDRKYGGHGASFHLFTHYLTKMATHDAMIVDIASIHACIGAADPVRIFSTSDQKQPLLLRNSLHASKRHLDGHTYCDGYGGSPRC